jgi:hypothetical protein
MHIVDQSTGNVKKPNQFPDAACTQVTSKSLQSVDCQWVLMLQFITILPYMISNEGKCG